MENHKKALVLVDIQNDFIPGGALAVNRGDEIIPIVNMLQKKFELIVATQDWHPANHKSFASNHPGKKPGEVIDLNGLPQVLWPDHCIQGSVGAEFHKDLQKDKWTAIFQKGKNPEVDSYSGFFDNARRGDTGLGTYLKEKGVDQVYICGLALDYCVKFTALDSKSLGFDTVLVTDATRAVNLNPEDGNLSIQELQNAGVKTLTSDSILNQ
ncbi:bifunctional nicotinamidase/pyrazinamidase [Algoriphagus sp. CAU 1675]|uniref:bifunctional nicotinamidase/pyrazinamidase n=1 Tax=Algoriphagus sp. CAU 1675 TaxID=3032597 RepID=UPI0023DB7DD8|nr:bifunctional nicotinamidase/pyrazinamidase [Algoriphagus sp. CAU 1675]MDF2159274.1 bifunctional nicotinamidase/pyrazinamidase [Algoriphagus sp. CAU 1675]